MATRVRRSLALMGGVALCSTTLIGTTLASVAAPTNQTAETTYLVIASEGANTDVVESRVEAVGGEVKSVNESLGIFEVTSTTVDFAASAREDALIEGVTRDLEIGQAPVGENRPRFDETMTAERAEAAAGQAKRAMEAPAAQAASSDGKDTLDHLLWGMDMIGAWQAHERGATGERVKVAVMDTGIDAEHPDIKPNFNYELSRNFTVDRPEIDGPCEEEADGSCEDAATVDEGGHGTHVAGSIAAAANGRGVTGVAPNVDLINLRTGQDSGYFFLKPTLEALAFAADNGVDVVNMSYYIDPWALYCTNSPQDSPEAQAEQRDAIKAVNRALAYATFRGVTLLSSAGNGHSDMDNPTSDDSSPNLPKGAAYERVVDNSCVSLPSEGAFVIGVTAVGPTGLKAYYSDYGYDVAEVSAPGGAWRDNFGTDKYKTPGNLVLSTVPKEIAIAELREYGTYNEETGESTDPFTLSDCPDGKESCAYYSYYQGTSMASPYAAGVAALIVGEYGYNTWTGDYGMNPLMTRIRLQGSAKNQACPAADFTYPELPEEFNGPCKGNQWFNSWYGEGIVNADRATRW